MSADVPNTKHCPVPLEVPREPSEYRSTVHFGQRLRERVTSNGHDGDAIIRECIQRGYCSGSCDTRNAERRDEYIQTFKFTAEADDVRWSVVVGLTRAGYLGDGKHDAVTIYKEGDT